MNKSVKPKRWKKWMSWVLWFLLFQFILINISASLHAWKFTHYYTNPELRIVKPSSKNIFVKTWKLFSGIKMPRSLPPGRSAFPVDSFFLKTGNGQRISCWYAMPDSVSKGTVVLFHGLTANKKSCANVATEFLYLGYTILMVDFRGHGSSSGNITTIGFRESEEVKLAFDFVKQKGETNIFLWGLSMGAVAIAKAINDYDIRPAAVMLEMPFASLQSHIEARSRVLGFPEEPFGFLVTGWMGIEQGFNAYKFKVTDYVKKVNCPVLLSWGTYDKYVMKEETDNIYKNIPGDNKRLVIYEGAEHQSLLNFDPVKWRNEVGNFLNDPISARP